MRAWAQRAASELSADRGAAAAAARAALQAVAKDQSSPQHRSTWSNGGRAGVAYRRGAAGDNAGEVACVDVLSDALAALGFEAEDEPEAGAGSEAEADMNTNGAIEDHVEATFGATLPPCHQVASIGTAQNEDGREKSNSTAWDEVEDSVGAADCGFEDDEGALSDDLSDSGEACFIRAARQQVDSCLLVASQYPRSSASSSLGSHHSSVSSSTGSCV